jgi:hypothetical protein
MGNIFVFQLRITACFLTYWPRRERQLRTALITEFRTQFVLEITLRAGLLYFS